MPLSDADQSDFMRDSASPHYDGRLFGSAAGPSTRAKSSSRATAARPSVSSSTLPKSSGRKFASSHMPDWQPTEAPDWGPVIPDEREELGERELSRRRLINLDGSLDADETLSASSVPYGSPHAVRPRGQQQRAAPTSSRAAPSSRAARPMPASALETIDDGETWYAHESFIPGVGRGVRTASGATGASTGGAVRDILNTQGLAHPSPSAASHRPHPQQQQQQQQQRRAYVAEEQDEDSQSQTSSESDDMSDTQVGQRRPPTANSTGNHAALRATPLGESRQAARHERPVLGDIKMNAFRAAEARLRAEKAKKARGEDVLSPDVHDTRRRRNTEVSTGSPATHNGSAFGRTAAMLTDQIEALGAQRASDAAAAAGAGAAQVDDEGSAESGFAPGPAGLAEHDDSSGQTLLGDPQDKYAQWKRQEQLQRAKLPKSGVDPWLRLPSGQPMAPSAFYSHLPDSTGLTSALGSPAQARLGVHHVQLGPPPKEARNQHLEGLADYVRGVNEQLGSAKERINEVEQRQGAYAQKVGHLQDELGELRRQRSSSSDVEQQQQQQQRQQPATPARPASRQREQQSSQRAAHRSAPAQQYDAAPEPAPAPAAEIGPVIAQLQAHVRQIESDLAAYKDAANALRAPTPPVKRAPEPRHARSTQTSRQERYVAPHVESAEEEAAEVRQQAGTSANNKAIEVDRLRAHIRRVENELARLRSYVDDAPVRIRASSPIRPPSALRHSAARSHVRSSRDVQRDDVSDGSEVDRSAPSRASRARYAASSPVPRARAYTDDEDTIPVQRASTPPTSRRHDTVERSESDADDTPRPASRHSNSRSRTASRQRSSSHSGAAVRADPAGVLLNDETLQQSNDEAEGAPVDEAEILARAERTFEIVAAPAAVQSSSGKQGRAGASAVPRLEHNAETCTVCQAADRAADKAERRRVRRERDRARATGSAASIGINDAGNAADEDVMRAFLDASADLSAGAHVPRLTSKQQKILVRLLRECTDEFIHQRMLYSELADALKAVEPSMPAMRRRIMAKHVVEAVEHLELKAQRINALQALLPPLQDEDVEQEHEQQQQQRSQSRSHSSKSSRSNQRAAPLRSHSPPTTDDMARPATAASHRTSASRRTAFS